jgi:hypothetical protein
MIDIESFVDIYGSFILTGVYIIGELVETDEFE